MSDLAQLKSQLRSLVVSSPTAVDARALLRDYRTLVGEPLPAARHGYRDPVQFLRERCGDCFVFQGPQTNPILTLIVTDQLKHIDEFVQRQKMPSTKNFRLKRRSILETCVQPSRNLISNTFVPPARRDLIREESNNNYTNIPQPEKSPEKPVKIQAESVADLGAHREHKEDSQVSETVTDGNVTTNGVVTNGNVTTNGVVTNGNVTANGVVTNGNVATNGVVKEGSERQRVLHRFLEKRIPLYQSQQLQRTTSSDSLHDDDSGRQTASSGSSGGKQAALERLKEEVNQLLAARPAGVWASQLMRLYEERFGRELNYSRLGFASIAACAVQCAPATRAPNGDWLLSAAPASPSCPSPAPSPAPRVRRPRPPAAPLPVDPDDALPGIEYDADVFPPDCLSFVESIPAASVAGLAPGHMIQLVVGEVYSPSHLWILRLGPDYDKMEDIMDEMTEYFTKGEGKNRVLAAGARRPGQYCSSVYDGDWHRSLIVQLVDSDTVKVRHVDYGTVDTVPASSLRPLRRAWASLPAQAVRARLGGLRPPAAGRRWPRAAAAHLLRLVRDTRLVGNVLRLEPEEGIVELLLIDTSTSEDVSLTDEMVRAGHADPCPRAAASEAYLFPLFGALESGATPNYAEIHALLRDGIALDYVEAYRRHVPPLRAPSPPSPPPPRYAEDTELTETESPQSDRELDSPRTTPESRSAPESDAPPDSPHVAPPLRNRVPLWLSTTASEPDSNGPAESPTVTSAERSVTPEPSARAQSVANFKPLTRSTEMVSVSSQTIAKTPTPPRTPVQAEPLPPLRPANAPQPPPPRHPPAFYAIPPGYYPPSFPPQYAQLPPRFVHPPVAYGARLSADECEVFELLSLVDKNAAHRYVSQALRRSLAAPPPPPRPPPQPLNPLAPEFRGVRPPPGFSQPVHYYPPPRR